MKKLVFLLLLFLFFKTSTAYAAFSKTITVQVGKSQGSNGSILDGVSKLLEAFSNNCSNPVTINSNSRYCLESALNVLPYPDVASQQVEGNFQSNWFYFQCVWFVRMITAGVFGEPMDGSLVRDADGYIGYSPPGYQYMDKSSGDMEPGDIVVWNTKIDSPNNPDPVGHIGIVVSVNGNIFTAAQANGLLDNGAIYTAGAINTGNYTIDAPALSGWLRKI